MPGPFDFKGQKIQDTYDRVVQIATGSLYDGKGTLINADIQAIADASDQRQSESIELSAISSSVFELQQFSSSLDADFATDAELSALSSSILVTTNDLSSSIQDNENELSNQDGRITSLTAATSSYVVFPYTGSAVITGSLEIIGDITGSPSFNIHAPNRSTGIKIGNSTTTTVGDRSTAIGVNATANTYDEISIGYNAGAKGSGNPASSVYIGNNAGNGGAGNGMGKRIGIGHTALGNNNGSSHVAIGDQAGRFGSGNGNVLIGRTAGYTMGGASQNVAIGQNAGNGSGGDGNIALGYVANGGDGNYNIALGYSTGNSSMTGTNNVLIGYYAGNTFTNESNKLIIASGSSPLVTGDFANNTLDISGSVSASTYYGDGSNLTGIETDPFPYTGSAIITGSLTVSGSVVDFTSASAVNLNIDSLPLINPIVEYLDVTSSIASGTTLTLPNNLSYISSSTYEYLEIFMNGLRTRYNIDFVPMSNTTIQTQIAFPSGSELTFKSLKR